MGSAAAFHVASRGKKVLGLERFTPAHSNGSSHGDSRIIRLAYHEHPSYVPLAHRAYELWRRLERDTNTCLLRETGGLMIGPPDSSVVQGAMLSAKQHNLAHEVLDAAEIRKRYPVLNPRHHEVAVYESVAGYLNPEAAINAHLQQAVSHGAELHFEEPVIGWSATESHVEVQTGRCTYQANSLIIAPGAWAPELLASLDVRFEIHRHVMCWFQPVSHASSFQPESFPIYIWDVDGSNCFYGFPATQTSVGVKAALHSGGQPCTVQNVDRTIHASDIAEVRQYLQSFIPALNGEVVRSAACLYTMTQDQHFVVGLHPRHPNVALAAGFSGHGFKFTSVMGEILADLAIEAQTSHKIGFLSPHR
jgi:sarcosine oxidase